MTDDNSWLTIPATTPPVGAADDPTGAAPPTDEVQNGPTGPAGLSNRSKIGIVATAVVVGAIGVVMIQSSSSATPAAANGGFGGPPGAAQQGGPGGPGGGFRVPGLQGTVDAVSSSSITVDGTTVKLTGTTEVIVNGSPGSLSDITKGATVFVHTEGTGSGAYAERVFVGGMPARGGFGAPPGTGTTSKT